MLILSYNQLKEVVLYSRQQIDRLEKAGQFPKRVRLGKDRIGWVESEIYDYLKRKIDNRSSWRSTPEGYWHDAGTPLFLWFRLVGTTVLPAPLYSNPTHAVTYPLQNKQFRALLLRFQSPT